MNITRGYSSVIVTAMYGKRLVVAEPDVERRPVALDEVLLEVERLRLGARDDDLDVVDALDELRGPETRVAALEVAAHTRAQATSPFPT